LGTDLSKQEDFKRHSGQKNGEQNKIQDTEEKQNYSAEKTDLTSSVLKVVLFYW